MREFLRGMYTKSKFAKRLALVLAAVIVMGFALSWLVLVDMGTDPCTSLNLAVSAKLGISLGNWQALFNCFLFIFVIWKGREYIGFGMLANMFLVGYSLDFFSWLWRQLLPAGLFDEMALLPRLIVLVVALAVFIVAVAVYVDVDLGTAPYDAIPFIICKLQHKVPFRFVRMAFDLTVIICAWILGARIGIVTIVMGFTLGPVITWVGDKLSPYLQEDDG